MSESCRKLSYLIERSYLTPLFVIQCQFYLSENSVSKSLPNDFMYLVTSGLLASLVETALTFYMLHGCKARKIQGTCMGKLCELLVEKQFNAIVLSLKFN